LGDVLAITGNLRQGQEPLNYELGLTYIAKSHFLILLERRDLSRKAKSHLLVPFNYRLVFTYKAIY
jgi:hypothetical protein